jgi:hypothetical protein
VRAGLLLLPRYNARTRAVDAARVDCQRITVLQSQARNHQAQGVGLDTPVLGEIKDRLVSLQHQSVGIVRCVN